MANKIDIGSFFNQSQEGGKADIALNLAQQSFNISKAVQAQISGIVSNISTFQTIIESNDDTIKTSFFELQTSFENLKASVQIISDDVDSMSKVFFKMNKEDLQKVRDEAKETFELEDKKQKEGKKKKKKKDINEASDKKFEDELKDKVGLTQGGLAAAVVGAGSIQGWFNRGKDKVSDWFGDKFGGKDKNISDGLGVSKNISDMVNLGGFKPPVTESEELSEEDIKAFAEDSGRTIEESRKILGEGLETVIGGDNVVEPNVEDKKKVVEPIVEDKKEVKKVVKDDDKKVKPTVGGPLPGPAGEAWETIGFSNRGKYIVWKRKSDGALHYKEPTNKWEKKRQEEHIAKLTGGTDLLDDQGKKREPFTYGDVTYQPGTEGYKIATQIPRLISSGNKEDKIKASELEFKLFELNKKDNNNVKPDNKDNKVSSNNNLSSNNNIKPVTKKDQNLLKDITNPPSETLVSQVLDAIEVPGTNTSSVQNSGQTNDSPPPTVPTTTGLSGTGCDIDCVNLLKGNSAYNMSIA